jgi:LysM repeat protein
MSLNQELMQSRGARLAGVSIAALLLASCGGLPWGGSNSQDESASTVSAPAPTRVAASPPDSSGAVAEEMTATEAAVSGLNDAAPAEPSTAQSPIRPDAPMNYTVKRGDTLWDIASMFLRDPWLWPEIWQVNPQVENPHLIYPGDTLSLAYGADGRPQIGLTAFGAARLSPRLRSTGADGPIATIPYGAIASFLSRPSVLSKDEVEAAPRVLAFRDGNMVGGSDQEIYVRNLPAQPSARYAVVNIGDKLIDPETGDLLGYTGTYSATAVVNRPGEPAKAFLTDTARETLQGDRLIANDVTPPLNFLPRSPERDVKGQIISVVDGVNLIGQYQIVAINRGARDGIETGHVLAVDQAGEIVRDKFSGRKWLGLKTGSAFAPRVKLPDERSGTMLIFKTYDRMSYGLILSATNTIRVADRVRTP